MGLTNGQKATFGSAPGDTVISTGQRATSGSAYTLDGVGNRTNADLLEPLIPGFDPGSIGYTYNFGNILATAESATYTHDANGNRTQKVEGAVTVDYTYDSLNRLTQLTDGTQTIQYIYNGLGQRVGKIEDGVQTNYLIDPNGLLPQVLAEMDENNDLIAFYVYNWAGLVAKITSSNDYYYYHYDGLGSTVAITDSTAQIVNAYAYSPYGLVGAQETINNPFTYVGYFGVMAEGNGLYYMRARYYDPEVGRFINKDPIGYAGGDLNLYAYVWNNPLSLIDPSGLAVVVLNDPTKFLFGSGDECGAGTVTWWGYAMGGLILVAAVLDDAIGIGAADDPLIPIILGAMFAAAQSQPQLAKDIGPSGKPKINVKKHPTKKRAKDAAREEGKGKPIKHPPHKKGGRHFHPTDKKGRKMPTHHEYP